jgi:hypothetical protein
MDNSQAPGTKYYTKLFLLLTLVSPVMMLWVRTVCAKFQHPHSFFETNFQFLFFFFFLRARSLLLCTAIRYRAHS